MNNQKLLILGGIISLLIIVLAGYFLFVKKPPSQPAVVQQQPSEETVNTISPKDIGLTLTAGVDGKRVEMDVVNTQDLASVDYELSYTSKGDIPRGALGHVDVKVKGKPIHQEIVLGTCSDVCHYDQEVSNIKLIVKVTKDNDKVYQTEESLSL